MTRLLLLVALASASQGFDAALRTRAAKAPDEAFSQAASVPADFAAFLKSAGVSTKGAGLASASGEALSNAKVRDLYERFKAAPGAPAAPAAVAPAPAAKLDDLPWRFTGIELGKGPHPGGDLFDGEADRKGLGLGARVRLDGLGLRAQYRHAPSWPSFSAGFLKTMDLVGGMNLDRAREGIYAANFVPVETPQGGFEASGSAVIDHRYGLSATYLDKETVYPGLKRARLQAATLGFGLTPLGRNEGKPWNFSLHFSPDYQWRARDYPEVKDEKDGAGFSAGAAFRYALNKLPVRWLQPPPKGNGVVWPDQAKTSLTLSASKVTPMAIDWAAQASVYVTKHLLLTPGVRTTIRPSPDAAEPDGRKVGVSPLLGLDLKNLGL